MPIRFPLVLPLLFVGFLAPSTVFAQPGGRGFGGPGGFGGGGERIEPEDLSFELGVATIPDRETFERLSYQGPMRMDDYLSDLEFVKFVIDGAMTSEAKMYWMNTENIQAHPRFMSVVGLEGGPGGRGRGRGGFGGERPSGSGMTMRGAVTFLPRLQSPDGTAGLYIFDFQPNDRYSLEEVRFARDTIVKTMPFVQGKLAFHPLWGNVPVYESEKSRYETSNIAVYLDEDIYRDIAFLPLNLGESFGLLRVMDNEIEPRPREIILCQTLPNQMPRVAGIISAVRQTPLSHVNLRAVQDDVPNAFVAGVLQSDEIKSLIGKLVRYEVTPQGYDLREATQAEVDAHFQAIRPTESPPLERDLTRTEITPLAKIAFSDSSSFGVKAANLATLHSLKLPPGTVPEGVAIPFYFYDEFMKHNGFYEQISRVVEREEFRQDRDVQQAELKRLRSLIKDGTMPQWMLEALAQAQASFPAGASIRCRSSTNNEDLTGFSGAGLYDSYTHHPDEGQLSKSIKQVYASLWNFRAFEQREFHRVDHMQVAMGVVLHPNYSDELANGVAVTDDVLYETRGNNYLNVQIGEDLVTNPDAQSTPEELLLGWWEDDGYQVVREAPGGEPILQAPHLNQLRDHLGRIHQRFRQLYGKGENDRFAMEVEFKITEDGQLAIKQARPWVY